MNPYRNLPEFKVLEPNLLVSLRNGHMLAQTPTTAVTKTVNDSSFVENGYVYYLDTVEGELELVAPSDATDMSKQTPFLIYTEELFDGISNELKHFATEADSDDVAYVRALALYVGDVFTTNNIDNVADGMYYLADDGSFTNSEPTDYTGPVFHGVSSYLPDGTTEAVELTFVRVQ